jgi:hypothetical protein
MATWPPASPDSRFRRLAAAVLAPELEDVQRSVTDRTLPELEGRRHELQGRLRRLRTEVLVGASEGDGWDQMELDMIGAEIRTRLGFRG